MERFSFPRDAAASALILCALAAVGVMTAPSAPAQPAPPVPQCARSQATCPANSVVACVESGRCLDRGGRRVEGCLRYGCDRLPPDTRPPRTPGSGGGADDVPPRGPGSGVPPSVPGGWQPVRPPPCAATPKCGARRVAACVDRGKCSVVGAGPSGCRQYACLLKP